MSDLSLVIEADASAVAATVANRLVERLCALQAEGQVPSLVLTGGTIADQVHRELAQAGGDLDWSRVELWWGDERFVPRDDPDRNEGQVRTTFLDQVGVDPARVHPMPASDQVPDIAAAAASYAEELARHTADSGDDAVFDIVMLGIGPDGHVASLFPGHANVHVKGRAVVAETSSPSRRRHGCP
ncbi:MAG: 6-phosphogluconolactonase [Nocardioidaceae bacterium]